MDNMKTNNQASIIDMESKVHDQVVSILIDPGSIYSYISPNLVDNCFLNN